MLLFILYLRLSVVPDAPHAVPGSAIKQCSITRCAITRCREIMMPHLSIVKTRFAKASLRPRCARHRSWRATCQFPNGCVGHSATQWLRGSSSFPNRSRGSSSRLRQADPSSTIRPLLRLTHCWPNTSCPERWRSASTEPIMQVANSSKHDGCVRDRSTASFLLVQLATRGAALTPGGFYTREHFVATMHFS